MDQGALAVVGGDALLQPRDPAIKLLARLDQRAGGETRVPTDPERDRLDESEHAAVAVDLDHAS